MDINDGLKMGDEIATKHLNICVWSYPQRPTPNPPPPPSHIIMIKQLRMLVMICDTLTSYTENVRDIYPKI